MNAVVVGCGVIGLTSAIRLQEAGFGVRIVTRALPPETTSAVAAAVWYPYKAYPEDRVLAWGRRTLEACYGLAEDAATGVSITTFVELFDRAVAEPWWKDAVRAYRHAAPEELPPGYVDGYVVEAPLVEAPVHLRYLRQRFEAGGGTIEVVPEGIRDLAALCTPGRLVVNCTGLGARALCADEAVYPIRGQVVRVRNPGLERCLADDEGPLALTYVVPRRHDVVLGGTAEAHDWRLAPDPATTQRILQNAARLEPRLRDPDILEVNVGLRPGRREVRLEIERLGPGGAVIHNYGHGGSGFTLAWGCADEVLALARPLAAGA